jgi:molybdopterin-guanine dinucleotide biosynthesis protein A
VTAARAKTAKQVAGFVLAGGRSSRMGRNKALLEIGGVPLLVRTVRALQPVVNRVTVIGPPAAYRELHLTIVGDNYPGAGPLGGIATALAAAQEPWSFVLACDMPYLGPAWLQYLIERALVSSCDVVLPESAYSGAPLAEPLCALYHRRAGAPIRAALERGVRKVMEGLAGLRIERITAAESQPFDGEGMLFQNLNSREDYEAARARLERDAEGQMERRRAPQI